jgi:hypothetical protein
MAVEMAVTTVVAMAGQSAAQKAVLTAVKMVHSTAVKMAQV